MSASSAKLTPASGSPRTAARLRASSMSASAASSLCAAIVMSLARSSAAVTPTAPAVIDPLRLPPVPAPNGVTAVSPWIVCTSPMSAPSASAVSWTTVVSRLLPVDPPAT